ncbi:hypothetical protein F2P44_21790 [Massilia sp. CCM 8695]|uniref:Uncharacterized protein n=1 Tax=Massilia frigida TaxID=2609281 RepID=A0ABX0N901_9BURK|nr:hypothetical protein [Massilia frigida]NHZ81885.1 hypothetical protein [Massilia frigida]
MTTMTGTLDLGRIPDEQFDPHFHLRVAVVFYDQVLGSVILKPVSRTVPLAFSVPFSPALFGFRRLPAALTVVIGADAAAIDLLGTDTLRHEVALAGLLNAPMEALVIPVGTLRPGIAQYGRWLVGSGFFPVAGGMACTPPDEGALDAEIAELGSEDARRNDYTIESEDDNPGRLVGTALSADEERALDVMKINTDAADDRGAREVRVAGSCSSRPWHVAPSLLRLRAEINLRWPDRDKRSDGTIGDQSHCERPSDHNPNERSSVNAVDVDKDGIAPMEVVRAALLHPSTNYVIFNKTIWSREYGFRARQYTGANPHTAHVHVSILPSAAAEQDSRGWRIWPVAAPKAVTGAAALSVDGLRADGAPAFDVGRTYEVLLTLDGKQFEVALTVLRAH